jgi:biotin carboxyl carrier protein
MKYRAWVGGQCFDIELDHEQLVRVNGDSLYVDLEQIGGLPLYSMSVDGEDYVIFVEPGERGYHVETQGKVYPIEVQCLRPDLKPQPVGCTGDGEECLTVRAPLAGRLIALPVTLGEPVTAGQLLAVIESMKMRMELRAPLAGVVDAIPGPPKGDVRQDQPLIILRPESVDPDS